MVVPELSVTRAAAIAALINKVCPSYGIDSADVMHEFIATCAHESWGFTKKSENMNYSSDALLRVFGKKYFRTRIEADRYARQPEKIANYVYGGRMGNKKPGDGFLFRGAGFIQMTGRDMFTRYGARNKKTAEEMVELVRTSDYYAMDSACWIFAIEKGLVPVAIRDDFNLVTRRINGGYNGMADRQKYYERAKTHIKDDGDTQLIPQP